MGNSSGFRVIYIHSNETFLHIPFQFHWSRYLSHKHKILLLEILREYHNCQLSVDGIRFSLADLDALLIFFKIFGCSFVEVIGSHFYCQIKFHFGSNI